MTRDKDRSKEHEDGTRVENERKRGGGMGGSDEANGCNAADGTYARSPHFSHAIYFGITSDQVRSNDDPLNAGPFALPHAASTYMWKKGPRYLLKSKMWEERRKRWSTWDA